MTLQSKLLLLKWTGLGALAGLIWTFLGLAVMSLIFGADSAGDWVGSFKTAAQFLLETLIQSPWAVLFCAALGLMIGFYKLKNSRAN